MLLISLNALYRVITFVDGTYQVAIIQVCHLIYAVGITFAGEKLSSKGAYIVQTLLYIFFNIAFVSARYYYHQDSQVDAQTEEDDQLITETANYLRTLLSFSICLHIMFTCVFYPLEMVCI
jgi:hypothetical protein